MSVASSQSKLERKAGIVEPAGTKGAHGSAPQELQALSRIIAELNERFGLDLGPEHRLTLERMMAKLDADPVLDAATRVNPPDDARLAFDHKVNDMIQEIVDSNFELYKLITDNAAFGAALKDLLFDRYLRARRNVEASATKGDAAGRALASTPRRPANERRRGDDS